MNCVWKITFQGSYEVLTSLISLDVYFLRNKNGGKVVMKLLFYLSGVKRGREKEKDCIILRLIKLNKALRSVIHVVVYLT